MPMAELKATVVFHDIDTHDRLVHVLSCGVQDT